MFGINGDRPHGANLAPARVQNVPLQANRDNLILRISIIASLFITLVTGSLLAGGAVLLLGIAAHFSDVDGPADRVVYVQQPSYTRYVPFYNYFSRPTYYRGANIHPDRVVPAARPPIQRSGGNNYGGLGSLFSSVPAVTPAPAARPAYVRPPAANPAHAAVVPNPTYPPGGAPLLMARPVIVR